MIRRRAPIVRNVGLARPTKPIGRNAQPARKGRRAKRDQAAWTLCKAIVITRSGGACEGNVSGVCPRWPHGAMDVHHLHPEDRDKGLHDAGRCLHLCRWCHDWTHTHPAEAKRLGLLRPDPPPIDQTPLWPEIVSETMTYTPSGPAPNAPRPKP